MPEHEPQRAPMMINRALHDHITTWVQDAYPSCDVAGRSKLELLTYVADQDGPGAIIALSRRIAELAGNPIITAVCGAPDAHLIAARWQRLERFGHNRHRTRTIEHAGRDDGAELLRLEHYDTRGAAFPWQNDMFVWGLYIGLFDACGATVERAIIAGSNILEPGDLGLNELYEDRVLTREITFVVRFAGAIGAAEGADDCTSGMRQRVEALLRGDLIHSWVLDEVAEALRASKRSVQRGLSDQGTSFSASLRMVRVSAARKMIEETDQSLTAIAFCTGFADLAHFTRTFTREHGVAPSAYRSVLQVHADSEV